MAVKNEEEWFRKFYEGTFLIKGWKRRMRELLRAIPASDREAMADLLADLGERIGREWAREDRVRRIDTKKLQKWGENLRVARRKGPAVLVDEIHKLDGEVKNILSA